MLKRVRRIGETPSSAKGIARVSRTLAEVRSGMSIRSPGRRNWQCKNSSTPEFMKKAVGCASSTDRLHKLSASFILGYHGCDVTVAERLLKNRPFTPSQNIYDWLGEGVYFWDSNPLRGLEFAIEASKRKGTRIKKPAVVGAVIDLGFCLDLTTSRGLQLTKTAFLRLQQVFQQAGKPLPENQPDGLRHNLDCAVLNYLHHLQAEEGKPAFDTVKGVFIEEPDLYPGSAFGAKNHIQVAVRNLDCIKDRLPCSSLDLDPKPSCENSSSNPFKSGKAPSPHASR